LYQASNNNTGVLPAGTSGQLLKSNGASAPSWIDASSVPFPTGTLMLFQQTAAPTGWTKRTTHNNKALRVVSGTAGSGGTGSFTSVFASRTPSGSVSVSGTNSGGSVSNHTLTTAQMPSHNHLVYGQDNNAVATGNVSNEVANVANHNGINAYFSRTTSYTGSGNSHKHGFTNPSWSGSGSFKGTAMSFAVQYVDLIIARKD